MKNLQSFLTRIATLILCVAAQRFVLAHTCPTDATDTGVGVTLAAFRINPDGSTGPAIGGGSVGICECLRLRMSISYVPIGPSGGKVAFFQGGKMTVSTLSGSFSDDVTPASGVPLIGNPGDPNAGACPGATLSFLSDFSIDYCVKATDVNSAGDVVFLARYVGGLLHIATDIANQPTGTTAISVHVDQGPACSIQPATQAICAGTSATFTASGTGAAPPFTFAWTGPNGFTASGPTITINNAPLTAGGTYTATVKDAHGCTSTCTASLVVNPCNPAITVFKQVVCVGPAGCDPFGPNLANDNKTARGARGVNCPAFCYRITVRNTGDVPLTGVTVSDSQLNLGGCGFPSSLAVGQQAQCLVSGVEICNIGDMVNTVTAQGQSAVDSTAAGHVSSTSSATVTVVPAALSCELVLHSDGDLDAQAHAGGPDDNHVTLPAAGPVQLALTVHNTGQADLSVAISGLPCAVDVQGNPIPSTVTLPAGQSVGPIVCVVQVACPAGAVFNVSADAIAVAGVNVPCVYDSQGKAITVHSQCGGQVECQAPCLLSVTKTACVVTNAAPAADSCTGGAIAVRLEYTGPAINAPTVVQVHGSSGPLVVYNLPSLNPGDILSMASENGFTLDATAHGATKLGAQTTVTINTSYEILHTSCSCTANPETNLKVCNPVCLDASSPDNPTGTKGPASPLWTLAALKDPTLGVLTCPTLGGGTGGGGGECTSVLPALSGDTLCKGKIHALQLAYMGGGCAAMQNLQDAGKVTCKTVVNDPTASPVRIRVSDGSGGKVYLDTGTPGIEPGGVLSLTAGAKAGDTFAADMLVSIYNAANTLIEQVKFKTDCSQPVRLGDLYGGLKVIGMTSLEGGAVSLGTQVNYTYVIQNNGAVALTDVTVIDDQLGPIPGSPIATLGAGQTVTLEASVLVTDPVANTVTVTGKLGNQTCTATATAAVSRAPNPCPCVLGYPFTSSNPRTSILFSESECLRAFSPNVAGPNDTLKVWYNDEHALTLGVRRVIVKSSGGTATNDYPVTPLGSVPGSALHPAVGTTALTGDQAGTDQSERPMWPALFITDVTLDPDSRANDWQFGGTPIAPHAVFGAWKGAVRTVDKTVNPPVVTVTPDADPATKNDTLGNARLGPDGDVPALGFTGQYLTTAGTKTFNEGFTAEARWNISDLIAAGIMQTGHVYRVQFMVHDGDQNKTGGDVGENCATVALAAQVDCPPPPPPARECSSGIVAFLVKYTGPDLVGPTTLTFSGSQAAAVSVTYSFPNGLANGSVLSLATESDPGRPWTIDATKHGQTKLGTRTSVFFNGVLTEVLHTSCSCNMNNFVPGLPACLDATSPDNPTATKGEPSPLFLVLDFK